MSSFLRSRRERISPEQAGLPATGRRRTPGLRREEVAQLAGVGVTWYTWLEQGRDINVSEQVLAAIAGTLRLDPYERVHLYTLAGHPEPPMDRDSRAVPGAMAVMMRQLEPIPAAVINARFDLLAYNRTYERMVGGLEHLPFEDRNQLLLVFTSPRWRTATVDWEDFERLWDQHDVRAPENFTKRYLHPEAGLLTLDYTQLWFGERSEIKLTTYTPVDEGTWAGGRLLQQDMVEG